MQQIIVNERSRKAVWDGEVEAFELTGHHGRSKAIAGAASGKDDKRRREVLP
jgi:hypothetical protein